MTAEDEAATEFRSTPRQRRNGLIGVVIIFGVAVAGGFIAYSAKSAGAAEFAAIGGLSGLICLYAYLASVSARTVFGSQGISGRSLASRYAYRWEQIGNVSLRTHTSRGVTSYTVILTTTDGDRIRLGAPMTGGIMGDPAFADKYAQIRAAWQAATGRTGPEAETTSTWTRGFTLLTAGLIVQLFAAIVIWATLSAYGPALAAHEGKGTRGDFMSELPNCQQVSCTWFGQFRGAGGNVRYATLAPGGPFITHPNDFVPAVDTGDQSDVYPVGGGTDWKRGAVGLAAGGAVMLVAGAAELLLVPSYLRRRRRLRAGLAQVSELAG